MLTSSGIPRFWMKPCQTGLLRSHDRPSTPLQNSSHSSERSPPRPFWALCLSCAKLLICLVTSQCFLHGTEREISTLLCAVNHSTLPLLHWYHHYSIRLHSNSLQFLFIIVTLGRKFAKYFVLLFRLFFSSSYQHELFFSLYWWTKTFLSSSADSGPVFAKQAQIIIPPPPCLKL